MTITDTTAADTDVALDRLEELVDQRGLTSADHLDELVYGALNAEAGRRSALAYSPNWTSSPRSPSCMTRPTPRRSGSTTKASVPSSPSCSPRTARPH